MNSFIHRQGNFELSYIQFGKGEKTLLAFHGFGRKKEDFLHFENVLGEKYTVYSFDFFHHGNSVYPSDRIEKNTLTREELSQMISAFLDEKGIENISLMGYSMGGKISLQLLQMMPERIKELYLLAPDGIVTNFWYKFSSRNKLGNYFYKKILHKPDPFFNLLKFLRFTKILREKLYRFVLINLETEEKRQQVFNVWMTLRNIEPSPKKSAELIKKFNIPVYMFYGIFDPVIKLKTGKYFAKKINQEDHFFPIECGHNLFNEKTEKEIRIVISD